MYMILFEEQGIIPPTGDTSITGDTSNVDILNVVSAIMRVEDSDAAIHEWNRVGDVYSAYVLSDIPAWDIRIITHR